MSDVPMLYLRHFDLTKDPQAAALLTLAEILSSRQSFGLMTVADAADYLNVSRDTIRNLIDSGKIPASRIGNGRGTLRLSVADLDRYKKESAGFHRPALGYTTRLLPPRTK